MYDIFYVSRDNGIDNDWNYIKSVYPLAQKLTNIKSYDELKSKAFTKMFWVIWDDVVIDDSFNLLEYRATKWDDMYIHVFRNGEYYDGICLFPKNLKISQREFDNRFFTDKKEINIVASRPRGYDKFHITSYEQYLDAKSQSTSNMFWAIWPDIELDVNFKFDYKVPKYNTDIVHIFKNGEYYDGICLFPKNSTVSRREFYHRFFTDKKEIDIVASYPKKYSTYRPKTYEEYQRIDDEMFWIIWPEVSIVNESVFELYFSHHNSYDRRENHVFQNLCNGKSSYLSGIILCSKYKPLSKKEFENQYAVDKKEHNIVASKYQYPVYRLDSYEQYLKINKNEYQKMFWGIWPEIQIVDKDIFDLYFDPNDGLYDYDRDENHAFLHSFNNDKIFVNGLCLFSKSKIISKKEFTHRFLITKKEHDRLVSEHSLYDVVFISYNEPNADQNYEKLLKICPRVKRIHGIKGIHQAHIMAAKTCSTDMIWIVDGDAIMMDGFNFNLVMSSYDIDCVHVWRSQNPINGLIYGNGGVKLLPRVLTLNMDIESSDMTTSISKKFKAMDQISNINEFNTDEFSTWRSAFRECCKLSSRVIERQHEEETLERLDTWCSKGADKKFGIWAIKGAQMGRSYGLENKNNLKALKKINDFDWLKRMFDGIQ